MKKLLMTSLACVALAGPAMAGDDARWSGFYVGVNGGYGWGDQDQVGIAFTDGRSTNVGRFDKDGGFAGVQLGYNWQLGKIVLGVEADFQGGDISAEFGPTAITAGPIIGTFDGSSETKSFGTVRGRAGIALDQLMIYATGGYAWANVDYQVRGVDAGGNNFNISSDDSFSGWVVGGGLEWAFSPNWTAKVEYQHINLGSKVLSAPIVTAAGVPVGVSASTIATPEFDTIRVGLNYKFGQREEYEPMK